MAGRTRQGNPRSVAPEQRLRGMASARKAPRRRCSGATLRGKTALGPPEGARVTFTQTYDLSLCTSLREDRYSMAYSDTYPSQGTSPDILAQTHSNAAERRIRRISIWLMLFFLFQGGLGAVWDREWHAYVGRDQFWTPPHTLIYSRVTGA